MYCISPGPPLPDGLSIVAKLQRLDAQGKAKRRRAPRLPDLLRRGFPCDAHARVKPPKVHPMRTLIALCLALSLAAFAPPQPQPESPDRTQVQPPKSWIPEKKPNTDPPITALVDPPSSQQPAPRSPFAPAPAHQPSACTIEDGEFSPAFRLAVDTAQREYEAGEYDAALKSVETASLLATSDLQRYLVDMLSGQVFKSMRNRQGYEASLRSLIARDCFLVPGEREIWQQYLDELTGRTDL
jgi:hypothetical protein